MAESEQSNLEDILLSINQINGVLNDFDKPKTDKEQAKLYDISAEMISGQKKGEPKHTKLLRELTRDPAYAYDEVEGYRNTFASNFQGIYEQNKESLIKNIETKINVNLKELGSHKGNAIYFLVNYLQDILKVKKLTQEQVDMDEKQEVLKMGVPYAFEARGSVEENRQEQLGEQAKEYLKEVKEEGKVTHYVVDSQKLAEAMGSIVNASSIYARTKQIEDIKTKAAEKADKN